VRDQGFEALEVDAGEAGEAEVRQPAGDAVEARADGGDTVAGVEVQEADRQRRRDDDYDVVRHARGEAAEGHQAEQAAYADPCGGRGVEVVGEGAEVGAPLTDEVAGTRLRDHAEEVGHLLGEDDEGDAAGEAGGDGIGDELDHRPELEEPHDEQDRASHETCHGEALVAELVHDAGDDDDEGAGGSGDGDAAAAQE
jgi:hypothetical protein